MGLNTEYYYCVPQTQVLAPTAGGCGSIDPGVVRFGSSDRPDGVIGGGGGASSKFLTQIVSALHSCFRCHTHRDRMI